MRRSIRRVVTGAGPRTWHIRDFYDRLPRWSRGTVRKALHREVGAGFLVRPGNRPGLFARRDDPPLWDEAWHYENVRLLARQGVRGSRPVPLLELLARRFRTQVEEVWDESNLGYHFSGLYDTLHHMRPVTLSLYPTRGQVFVILGSAGRPLAFWELFTFFMGWLPGVTGLPVPAWEIRSLELNRDFPLEKDVGPLWALTRPLPLTRAVTAMLKVYTHRRGGRRSARAEVRLSGDVATDALLDELRAMMDWTGRLDR